MLAVPLLYRWLALAALMGVSALFGAMKMHTHDTIKYDALVASVKAEGEKQIAHTNTIIAQQKVISHETESAFTRRLADLRRYYAGRVSVNPGLCILPAIPVSARPIDGPAADPVSDPPGTTPDLTRQCAETTLMLLYLQRFNKQQAGLK